MAEMMIPVDVVNENCAQCPELEVTGERLYTDGTQVVRTWRCRHVDVCRRLLREVTRRMQETEAAKEGKT